RCDGASVECLRPAAQRRIAAHDPGTERKGHFRRPVHRAAIDDDDLGKGPDGCPGPHAGHGGGQVVSLVEGRDDDAQSHEAMVWRSRGGNPVWPAHPGRCPQQPTLLIMSAVSAWSPSSPGEYPVT